MNFAPALLLTFWCFSPVLSQSLKLNHEHIAIANKLEVKSLATGDSLLLAHSYYRHGHAYSFAGDNGQAKRYYIKALKILENRHPSYDLGHIYVRLCEVLNISIQSSQDINYSLKAIAIFEKIKSSHGLAMSYGMLQGALAWRWSGKIVEGDIKFDSLMALSRQELKYAKIAKDTTYIVDAYVRFALTHDMVSNSRKSLKYLRQALQVADACENDTIRIRALLGFSDSYLHAHKPELARPYIEEVGRIYKRNNFQQFFILVHYIQSWHEYYSQKGDWRHAYQQRGKLYTLYRSTDLANYDRTTTLVDQELAAQKTSLILHSQQKENELSARLIKFQRWFILVTVILLVLTTVLTVLFFRLYRKFQRTSTINADISNRNKQLVREQNHRVKNNLQLISNLLSMQARQLVDIDAKQAILESKLRVQTMAIIQRKLYDSLHLTDIDLAEFIPELADDVLTSCGFGSIHKVFEIDPIILDIDRAIPIGLMITELIINASKYAFPNNFKPSLKLTCKQQNDDILLTIVDNGMNNSTDIIAKATTPSGKASFGTQLIQLLTQQLYGTSQYNIGKNSTEFMMKFPIQ